MMAVKLEDNCLLFDMMHALYSTRPHITPFYKDYTTIMDIMPLQNSMVVPMTNSLDELPNLNLLLKELLF